MKNKEFKSFYKVVGGGEGDRCSYPVRLDTYGCGCQHDCWNVYTFDKFTYMACGKGNSNAKEVFITNY